MDNNRKVMMIGITGGVGSGKSAVMDILKEDYSARIILADLVAHDLMEPGAANYRALLEEFGPEILEDTSDASHSLDYRGIDKRTANEKTIKEGTSDKRITDRPIDRVKLGKIVFSNPDKLERINLITHKGVKEEIHRRISNYKAEAPEGRLLIAIEAALLIGSGLEDEMDSLWYIYVNDEERIRRLQIGRGYTEEYARSILSRQISDQEFRKACDVIIDNSRSLEETKRQIKAILQ